MSATAISISFLGGAGTVTGSKTLIAYAGRKLMVDCGLFQGLKALRLLNREPLSVAPAAIGTLIVTHAHLDHIGYIPLLVKNGFAGRIYATRPTCELARVILNDSAKLQEEEAFLANRYGYSRHAPAQPLYTVKDAEFALSFFTPAEDVVWNRLDADCSFRFLKNGHILGSAFVELMVMNKKFVFSGDLGRPISLLMEPPARIKEADYLILESTYGDRDHKRVSTDTELADIVNLALRKKGNLIIPTFAVERAQEIMFVLNRLREKKMIPESLPVYLDSPMGIDVTRIMMKYPQWHKLSDDSCRQVFSGVRMVSELRDTMNIIRDKSPKIIIAGSGMLSGGRALEYLKAHLGNRRTTVLFVGYQAEGTRGRALLQGAKEIKIHGRYYTVRAGIKELSYFSGHADRTEILEWLSYFKERPGRIFLNHGEPASSDALRKLIDEKKGWECHIPLLNSRFEL
ncbi:MAG: MBL fold metallo-hydrolase [Bacteroidota bacterium]